MHYLNVLKSCFAPALAGLFMLCHPAVAQTRAEANFQSNGEVPFYCDFQDLEVSKSLFTMHDLSGLTLAANATSNGFSAEKPWVLKFMDDLTSTNYYAGSHSWFEPAGTANAWLVTTAIEIPAKGYTLSWKSESCFVDLLDCLRIFISTKGNDPRTDFTEPAVWESLAEPAGEKDGMLDGEWNEHSISLDAYAGQTVHIAFVNQSTNKGILCIDDVMVSYVAPYQVTNRTERISDQNEVKVKGTITAGEDPIEAFSVYYTTDGADVYTLRFDNANVQPGASYDFEFAEPMALTQKGTYQHYQLWASVEGVTNVGVTDSVAVAAFVPVQRAVLEEGTGAWCGNCPLGTMAIDFLHNTYGDRVISIAVHNDDAMMVEDYNNSLAFSAFPMGTVNRYRYLYPVKQNGDEYTFDGDDTFKCDVEMILSLTPIWQPLINAAKINEDGYLEIDSELRPAINVSGKQYCVTYVLTENNVEESGAIQSNYFYNYTNDFFGEFAKGGRYGKKYLTDYPFQEVARGTYPSYRGELADLPETMVAGERYTQNTSFDFSNATIEDYDQLYLTMLLIDDADGTIVNAHQVKVTGGEHLGIQAATTDEGANMTIHGTVLRAPGAQSVSLYNLCGQCLRTTNAAEITLQGLQGAVVAKAYYTDGQIVAKPMLLP